MPECSAQERELLDFIRDNPGLNPHLQIEAYKVSLIEKDLIESLVRARVDLRRASTRVELLEKKIFDGLNLRTRGGPADELWSRIDAETRRREEEDAARSSR